MPERRRELGLMSKQEIYDILNGYYELEHPVDAYSKSFMIDMIVEFEYK